VVADPVHQLHAGIGQERRQPVRGADRDDGVVRVGEQQRRLRDAGQGGGEGAELAGQRTLLGQEAAPQRPVIMVRVGPRCAS
jgi:hypothetical protein